MYTVQQKHKQNKPKPAYLVCFRIGLMFGKFEKKKGRKDPNSSNLIFQLIQVTVHNFNTLLVQEKVQSLGILLPRDMHIIRWCALLENQQLLSIS